MTPDIDVPQETALKVAHVEAVQKVLAKLDTVPSEADKTLLKEAQLLIKGLISLDEESV